MQHLGTTARAGEVDMGCNIAASTDKIPAARVKKSQVQSAGSLSLSL